MHYGQLVKKYPHYIGFGMLHYFFSSLGQTFLISVFVPYFNQNLSLDNIGFGLIYSMASLASAFTLPYLGSFIDKIRIRYMSIANGVAITLFCLLASMANHYIILFFALLGLRVTGQSMMVLIGSTAVARYFYSDRGKALSLAGLGLPAGEALMPLIVIFLINGFGWDGAWQILGLAVALIFIPASIFSVKKNNPFQVARNLGQKGRESTSISGRDITRKEVLKDPYFYPLILSFLFLPFFITGMFIHQNLLIDIKGWSMEWMATCFIGFGIMKIVTHLVAGPLIDRFTARRVFIFYLSPLFLGIITLLISDNPYAGFIYMLMIGITASLGSLSHVAMWTELYGVRYLGSIKSMITTMLVVSTSIGSVVFSKALANEQAFYISMVSSALLIILSTITAGYSLQKMENHAREKKENQQLETA